MSAHNLKSLVEVLNDLKRQDYTVDFNFTDGKLKALGTKDAYNASEVIIENEFRFEGESNPADSSILYAIKTTDDKKGTLVDSYGAKAHTDLEDFLKKADNQVPN